MLLIDLISTTPLRFLETFSTNYIIIWLWRPPPPPPTTKTTCNKH